jgi:hypothetical protein
MKKKNTLLTILYLGIITCNAQNFQWAKSMGGNSQEDSKSIAVDDFGNLYTIGWFRGIIDLDPGAGTSNLTSRGREDVFISKLDATGNFIWARSIGGTGYDVGYSITVDAIGNVYTTGIFQDTVDFDPGAGINNLTSEGGEDIFILKLDTAGNFIWAKSVGGISSERSNCITVDDSGNVHTTGSFQYTVDFDPGAGINNLTSEGGDDIFILKLDTAGNFIWAKSMGSTSLDLGNSIALDGSGNIYTTGSFFGNVDFNPGTGISNLTSAGDWDIFISKLDAAGNFIWAKSMGGPSVDVSRSIAVDGSGNVYTTGWFENTADFDPGIGTSNLISIGVRMEDIFISKLDSAGNFIWARRMGGASEDFGISIAVDVSGNVYTIGEFEGTADFDPGAGTNNLTSAGAKDNFISKLDAAGNLIWAKSIGGAFPDFSNSIAADGSGNIYTTGSYYGTVDFDPATGINNLTSAGSTDLFILKLGASSVNILENSFENTLIVYPNPTTGVTNIELGSNYANVTVNIRNLIGQDVFKESYRNSTILKINIPEKSGLYFIEVSYDEKKSILKVLKE